MSLFELPQVKAVLKDLQRNCRCGAPIVYKVMPEMKKDGVLSVVIKFAQEPEVAICESAGKTFCSASCHTTWHDLPEIKAAQEEKDKQGKIMVQLVRDIAELAKKGEYNAALKMSHDFMRGPFAKTVEASKVMGYAGNEQQQKVAADILTNMAVLRNHGASCMEDLRFRYDKLGNCVDFLVYSVEKLSLTQSTDVPRTE